MFRRARNSNHGTKGALTQRTPTRGTAKRLCEEMRQAAPVWARAWAWSSHSEVWRFSGETVASATRNGFCLSYYVWSSNFYEREDANASASCRQQVVWLSLVSAPLGVHESGGQSGWKRRLGAVGVFAVIRPSGSPAKPERPLEKILGRLNALPLHRPRCGVTPPPPPLAARPSGVGL